MKALFKAVTAILSVGIIFIAGISVFANRPLRMVPASVMKAFARNVDMGIPLPSAPDTDTPLLLPEPEEEETFQLMPRYQPESMFSDMDMQYAFLLLQQGIERSHLKDNAVLMLENGNEFVIRCWSPGMSLELTEALADNKTRLEAWQDAVDSLWNLDTILSRDIKETLGTDKSVTIQVLDDEHPEAVLLKIKDGKIEYNLMRDGTAPKYEVYGKN